MHTKPVGSLLSLEDELVETNVLILKVLQEALWMLLTEQDYAVLHGESCEWEIDPESGAVFRLPGAIMNRRWPLEKIVHVLAVKLHEGFHKWSNTAGKENKEHRCLFEEAKESGSGPLNLDLVSKWNLAGGGHFKWTTPEIKKFLVLQLLKRARDCSS